MHNKPNSSLDLDSHSDLGCSNRLKVGPRLCSTLTLFCETTAVVLKVSNMNGSFDWSGFKVSSHSSHISIHKLLCLGVVGPFLNPGGLEQVTYVSQEQRYLFCLLISLQKSRILPHC